MKLAPIVLFLGFAAISQAVPVTFTASLLGSGEVPPNASPATGYAVLVLNGDFLSVNVTFSGLIGGNASAAHIHCCTAPGNNVGVAVGFPGFPSATSGSYSNTFNLLDPSIYTSAFLNNFGGGTAAGAEAALIVGLNSQMAYVNIHNSVFPGGEIRGIVSLPEPAGLSLLSIGLGALVYWKRRRSATGA